MKGTPSSRPSENEQTIATKGHPELVSGSLHGKVEQDLGALFFCFNNLPFEIIDFGSPASGEHYFTRILTFILFYIDY